MEKERRIRLYGAAALAALASAAGGCTDAGGSLIIVQNQIPEDGCNIPSTPESNFRSRGRIDVRAADGYLFTPLVQSLIAADDTGANARVIAVQGADVELTFLSGFFTAEEEGELRDKALTR